MTRSSFHLGGPSFRGRVGVAREDISPPEGIYFRCWGAATHDTATGVHRPLTLTCVTFRSGSEARPLVLMSLDLMTWRSREDEWSVRSHVLESLRLPPERLMMCLTHTHASPAVQSYHSDKPGGRLIAPYLDRLRAAAVNAAAAALDAEGPGSLTWQYGRCDLATNRDFPDPVSGRVLCGHNPAVAADDTLLVGRVTDARGRTIGTIVNYACHPTTLAWENRLISPDYVGAMRETIERHTAGAPCLFLQGASGELAPAEQYTADTSVADRHGRRLGFAVVSTLESTGPADTTLGYEGVVESGAPLAVWKRRAVTGSTAVSAEVVWTELPLKPVEAAPPAGDLCDPVAKEKASRRRAIRQIVGDGPVSRMPLYLWRLGESVLVGQQNEAYSDLQIELRRRHPEIPVAVMNLVNGSGGYLPPAAAYLTNCYPVVHTPFASGSLERVIAAADSAIEMKPTGDSHA